MRIVNLFLVISVLTTGMLCQTHHMGHSITVNTTNVPSVSKISNATLQAAELINPQAKSILSGFIDAVVKKLGNSTLLNTTNSSSSSYNFTGSAVNSVNNSTSNTNITANITKINNSTNSNPNTTSTINNNNTNIIINSSNNNATRNNTNISSNSTNSNNNITYTNNTNIANSTNTINNNNNTLKITNTNQNNTTNSTTLISNANSTSNTTTPTTTSGNNINNTTIINSNSTTANNSSTILNDQFDNLDKQNTSPLLNSTNDSDINVKQTNSTVDVSDIYNLRSILSSRDPQFFDSSSQANNQSSIKITQLNNATNNSQNPSKSIKFSAFKLRASYEQWKSIHKKIYGSPFEEEFRRAIYFDNYKLVALHNANKSNTYILSLNVFADLQEEEFIHKYLTPKTFQQQIHDNHSQDDRDVAFLNEDNDTYDIYLPQSTRYQRSDSAGGYTNYTTSNITSQKFKVFFADLPTEFNWKKKGAVTPVKNQGVCGSCWAFSTTGVIEGLNFLRTNKLTRFSEQQLLDCCGAKGHKCDGCQGAWPDQAISYVKHYGLLKQSQYPYTGVEGACAVDTPTDGVYIQSQKYVASNTRSLKKAVTTQPVSVTVDASEWRLYSSGVFNNCVPLKYAANHAALLVGYTAEGNWIVKNSWGTSWGQNGYITLKAGNTCGIQNFALVAKI